MISDQELDRLVDGELSEAAYADLLGRMANDPPSWRRCALAFLERQAWEKELSEWTRPVNLAESGIDPVSVADQDARKECPITVVATKRRLPMWRHWIAAGLVGIMFSQIVSRLDNRGLLSWSAWSRTTQEFPSSNVDHRTRRDEEVAESSPTIAKDDDVSPYGGKMPSDANWALLLQEARRTSDGVWEMPVYDLSDRRATAALRHYSNLPRDLESQLRQAGHQVRRQRAYTPVQLEDGRQLVIPWEQVEIVPVSSTVIP